MAITKTWSATVSNGQQTQIQIDGTKVDSARVRWKGIDRYQMHYWSDYGEQNFPMPPSQYDITGGRCGAVVYVRTYDIVGADAEITFKLKTPDKVRIKKQSFPAGGEYEYDISMSCGGYGSVELEIIEAVWPDGWPPITCYVLRYWTYTEAEWNEFLGGTQNPKITVGSQTVSGPASVADGVWSNWYNVTLSPGLNRITHSIGGGGQVVCEIEYKYQPMPPKPTLLEPAHLYTTQSGEVTFRVKLVPASGSDSTKYHCKLFVSSSPLLDSGTIIDSSQDQSGWQYWTGSSWSALPSAGVSANTEVRYEMRLSLGSWYWAATTKDQWGYGYRSDPRTVRIVTSLTALEGYRLLIDNEEYQCLELNITESANGEISLVEARLKNLDGELKNKIAYGSMVYIIIYDAYGLEMTYVARVHSIDTDDMEMVLTATMGDKILTDRFCSKNYSNQDLGAVLRDIVSTDCAPLRNDGIPASWGVNIYTESKGRRPMEIFQEFFKQLSVLFWVDADLTDWVAHIANPEIVPAKGLAVEFEVE